ncbi:MAG: acyl-CoA thioesterase II [Streptosporangiales bacterium]|nr:acyl-CoA thioesterase II [Streptosporangiales bacterium]
MIDDASSLLRTLDLEQLDSDLFVAPPGGFGWQRTFGGQVVAQALRAAVLTVDPGRQVHSLHSYFIRGGRLAEPVHLEVTRTRDGGSFSTRSVTAVQEGKPIFELMASFQDQQPGEDWQAATPPSVPGPDALDPVDFGVLTSTFDVRPVNGPRSDWSPVSHPFWFRVTEPVGDDPAMHTCLLAYMSDLVVVRAAASPVLREEPTTRASLDHAVWFHRIPRVDEWLLCDINPAAHIGQRGLAQGSMLTADGTLVASIAQEALLRP